MPVKSTDPQFQAAVRDAYREGVTMRQVATALGVGYKTVWDTVHLLGIARSRGAV